MPWLSLQAAPCGVGPSGHLALDRQDFMGPGLVCEHRPRIEFRTHLETCCLESIKVQVGGIIL